MMRRLVLCLLILWVSSVAAANRYFVPVSGTNWSNTANWSTSSGGAGGEAVPTAADDVFLDGNSGATVTIDIAALAKTISCTGFLGQLVFNQNLTVSGNVTFISGMTLAADAATRELIINASATVTSGGLTLPCAFRHGTGVTVTLGDNWTISGVLHTGSVMTSNTFRSAGLNVTGTAGGTASNIITGGSWRGDNSLGRSLTLDCTSNSITIVDTVSFTPTATGKTLAHTAGAGAVIATGSLLRLGVNAASVTITANTGGMTWNNIHAHNSGTSYTLTLTTDLNIGGNYIIPATSATYTINGPGNVVLQGNANATALTTGVITGTAVWKLQGSGSMSMAADATGTYRMPMSIEGNRVFDGLLRFQSGTGTVDGTSHIKYVSGTPVTTGSTLAIAGNCNINASGMTWNVVTVPSAVTVTLPTRLTCRSIRPTASSTWAGAAGWTADTLFDETAGLTHTLQIGNDYHVQRALTLVGTSGSHKALKSSTASTAVYFILGRGASQNVQYVDATDINSRPGRLIADTDGILVRTVNWSLVPRIDAAGGDAIRRGQVWGGSGAFGRRPPWGG